MDTLERSGLDARRARNALAAFTLVEITIAIGIVAFAFISVVGMIPTGLNSFHQAMDASIRSQIAQRVLNDVQQTDFSQLIKDYNGNTIENGETGVGYTRFFDQQGSEIVPAARTMPPSLTSEEKRRIIYWVNTRVSPTTVTPYTNVSQPPEAANTNLATVTVQISNNPANTTITADTTTNLWNDPRYAIATYSAMVSRNSR